MPKKLQFIKQLTLVGFGQDTIPPGFRQDSVVIRTAQDTLRSVPDSLSIDPIATESIQLLFEQSNRRQEIIDSVSRNRPRPVNFQPVQEVSDADWSIDSSHIIFFSNSPDIHTLPNFDLNLPAFSYRKEADSGSVFIEATEGAYDQEEVGLETTEHKQESNQELIAKEKPDVTNDWILGVMLASFIILAWIRLFYNKFLSPTFAAVINLQVSQNLFRDKSSVSFRVSSGLNIIFYLNGGLFLFLLLQLLERDPFGTSSFLTFLLLSFILIGFYLVKHIVAYLVGVVSLTRKVFAEYMHNIYLFNKNLGLVLFPVILGLVYMPDQFFFFFLYSGLGFVGGAYVLRLFRGFQIFIKEGVSILYWILYLCALEILPILLFLKLSGLLVW